MAQESFYEQLKQAPLGKKTAVPQQYDASVLVPIERQTVTVSSHGALQGRDYWTVYELYWQDSQQKPHVAVLRLSYDSASAYIVESKSLKLYCNGLNTSMFESEAALLSCIVTDLEQVIKSKVDAYLVPCDTVFEPVTRATVRCLENTVQTVSPFDGFKLSDQIVQETVATHCFRSVCPVTGQPDFATIYIAYQGKKISDVSLFNYLVSFQTHAHFHEQCIEQIMADLCKHTACEQLTVTGCFTRRGGIDINPVRSTHALGAAPPREYRQ